MGKVRHDQHERPPQVAALDTQAAPGPNAPGGSYRDQHANPFTLAAHTGGHTQAPAPQDLARL